MLYQSCTSSGAWPVDRLLFSSILKLLRRSFLILEPSFRRGSLAFTSGESESEGQSFPSGKKVELNPHYEHQNSTGVSPNQQINALGLILNVFFRSQN
jgi:hypothetical protein